MYYLQSVFDGRVPEYEGIVHLQETIDLCPEYFPDELQAGLSILGCHDFMSYRDVHPFQAFVLFPLLHRLKIYAIADSAGAQKAAGEIIRMICDIETDDDMFPGYEVELIRNAVKADR